MQTPPATCPAQNSCVPSLTTNSQTAKDLETKAAETRTTLQGRLKNTELQIAANILALHLIGGSADSISQDTIFLLQVAYFCLHLLTELLELMGKERSIL